MTHKYISRGTFVSVFFLIFLSFNTFAQVGIGTTDPDSNALLDIDATNTPGGLLLPRVNLVAINNPSPLVLPIEAGMTVYNLATAGSGANAVTPGFYYHDGTTWVRIGAGAADPNDKWSLTGNTGTIPNTNFLGTIDNQPLKFRTVNADRFEITGGVATSRGRLRAFDNGSAAEPTYSWSSNIGTGMFQQAANVLGFSTASTERMRILADGRVAVNTTAPSTGDRFTVRGAANEYAINGYTSGASVPAIYGSNTTESGFGIYGVAHNGVGVSGQSTLVGRGVQGSNTGSGQGVIGFGESSGVGVWGQNNGVGKGVLGISEANGIGVQGQSSGTGDGVQGLVSGSGDGVYGQNTGAGNGLHGVSTNSSGAGVRALNQNATGVGLVAVGGNAIPAVLAATGATITAPNLGAAGFGRNAANGTGLSGVGNGSLTSQTLATGSGLAGAGDTGVYGISTTAWDGTGVIGVGNDQNIYTHPDGSGVAGTGEVVGVYGKSTTSGDGFGGVFSSEFSGLAYVGGWMGTTRYKILGNGIVSTTVQDVNEEPIIMFAPEAPEILLQDYGVGKLSNGTAVIKIDPNLAKNIRVDENHPLKVFVQLEGDCSGVYVTAKSAQGFTVKELQDGDSNVPFSWQIVATRANERVLGHNGEVRISDHSVRFPRAPKEFAPVKREKVSTKAIDDNTSQFKLKTLAEPVKEEKSKEKQQSQDMKDISNTKSKH